MENKENIPKSPAVSTQYVRRVLREINTSDVLDELQKPENIQGAPGPSEQQTPGPVPSTSAEENPQPQQRQPLFPDIRPEAFTRERRTLRHLAGRIYLIYCHLCCLDKKFRISDSDISFSDNEPEVVGNGGHRFYFGRAPELELENMVKYTVRFGFGESQQ